MKYVFDMHDGHYYEQIQGVAEIPDSFRLCKVRLSREGGCAERENINVTRGSFRTARPPFAKFQSQSVVRDF